MRLPCTLLLTALGAVLPAGAHEASGLRQSAPGLSLRIVVPSAAHATGWSHPDRLVIGLQDIARGYVDLEEGASMRMTTNLRAGYTIGVAFASRLLARAVVRVHEQVIEFHGGPRRALVMAPRMSDTPVRVGLRLYLAPDAAPGTYRWPLSLSVGAPA